MDVILHSRMPDNTILFKSFNFFKKGQNGIKSMIVVHLKVISFMFPRFLRNRAGQIMYLVKSGSIFMYSLDVLCSPNECHCDGDQRFHFGCLFMGVDLSNKCQLSLPERMSIKTRAGGLWEHENMIEITQKFIISSPWNHTSYRFSGLIFPLRKTGLGQLI